MQGRLGYPGLLGDLAQACTFCLEEPGVLDLFCGVGDRSSDVAAGGLGDGAGMSSPLGGEGALHLGEQGQQEEGDPAHPFVAGVDRQRVGQRPDADPATGRPAWR